jgi:hypothetical protein
MFPRHGPVVMVELPFTNPPVKSIYSSLTILPTLRRTTKHCASKRWRCVRLARS